MTKSNIQIGDFVSKNETQPQAFEGRVTAIKGNIFTVEWFTGFTTDYREDLISKLPMERQKYLRSAYQEEVNQKCKQRAPTSSMCGWK